MAIAPPLTLSRYIAEGRCVLFVGAGLSAPAGLPGWGKLLGKMVQQVRDQAPGRPDLPQLDSLLNSGRFLQVADYCRERLGDAQYFMFLKEQLKPTAKGIPPTHQTITKLPFRAIVTTNYDKLLERAYGLLTEDTPPILTHDEEAALGVSLFDNPFFILKAHGDIGNPESIILTSRDYRKITHERPAFSSVFSALLMTNAVLFLGYSLGDPDLNLLLDGQLSTFKDVVPPRFALMEDVGEVGSLVLKKSAGIDVQSYEKGRHEEVLEYLKALEDRGRQAPSSRSSHGFRHDRDVSELRGLHQEHLGAWPWHEGRGPGFTDALDGDPLPREAGELPAQPISIARWDPARGNRHAPPGRADRRGRRKIGHDGARSDHGCLCGRRSTARCVAWSGGRGDPATRRPGRPHPRICPPNSRRFPGSGSGSTDSTSACVAPWSARRSGSPSPRGTRAVRTNVRILLIGDTLNNLRGAREETEAIGSAYRGTPRHRGEEARRRGGHLRGRP